MSAVTAAELMVRFCALPVAPVLLSRLGGLDGIHLVGGAARDLLLGRAPVELDLAVEGDVDDVARLIGAPSVVYGRFGTATIELDGVRIDLARCRRERYSRPGALPEVEPAPLKEDLERRDLTVNAIALTLTGARAGELSAVVHAQADLQAGQLRVLHAASFRDDPTRLLRLARYHARLGFKIEAGTSELVSEAIAAASLGSVSGPRIGSELRLLVAEADPIKAIGALATLGLDQAIEPGFGLGDPDLARRAVELLGHAGRRELLLLGLGLQGVAASRLTALVDRLGFASAERDVLVAVAGRAGPLADALTPTHTPSEIAAAAGAAPAEQLAAAGALGAEAQVRQWVECLGEVRLEITGDDLLRASVEPGPAVGVGLRAALAAKLDGQAKTREQELDAALRAAGVRPNLASGRADPPSPTD